MDFVHLHLHTEYSVLDGASRIGDLMDRCREYGMHECAITDHGSLFGALDFYQSARKAGIKPVIGAELYLAKGSRFDKSAKSSSAAANHFLLLCKNLTGYRNLCRLSTLGYIEGFHYRPRIDLDLLAEHHEGLIGASACLAGEIPQRLLKDDKDGANEAIRRFVEIFGRDDFLIEVMDHGLPEEARINPLMLEMARHHGVKVIASNDSHYTDKADAEAHEALLCIQTNNTLDDDKRFRFPGGPAYYFTSREEMYEKFGHCPEVLANTREVAARCNVELPLVSDTGKYFIPEYVPPESLDKVEYLRRLVKLGLEDRFDGDVPEDYTQRAEYEIGIIEQMGFVDYFLVVWDLINYARNQGIPVGPGRGSGAGSLVAYALRITNIDPIRYSLLFERFLNPERVSMPDFDLDFCPQRRGEVIDYVREKYGAENVSQIITFGRMLAKAVVRNVGRALGLPLPEVDRVAKLIPGDLKMTLKKAYDQEPELQRLVNEDPSIGRLWSLALRLEGTIGNCSTHAAGVVICDEPLTNHVALFKAASSDVVATQFEMKGVEEIGLLKMDFLGLRNLTVIHEAVRQIKENRNVTIDPDTLEPADKKAYALLRSGNTAGIFQLESSGMRDLARRIGLQSLEEICALVALFRPGPMALKDQYIECKYHPERIRYVHPLLEPILAETYGVALYQEQVMQIVQAVAGFSLGQADILRRAMGKKKADLMAKQRGQFLAGAKANGIDEATATTLFERIEQFAGYGFNKSHSMAYAYVAYQTAFLKANYPVEFMSALLTSESGRLDKVAEYVAECRRMKLEVLPPDVNSSFHAFTVEGDKIRFGLSAVKNVGDAPVSAIVEERERNGPYTGIFDFCARVDMRQVNRRVIESLNQAGAFVSTGWNRREVEESLDAALGEGQVSQRERQSGQTSLLDLMTGDDNPMHHGKPGLEEWAESQVLACEREILGLYVSSHPLDKYVTTLERFADFRLADLPQMRENREVVVGGLLATVRHYVTQRGKKMAFLTLDTLEGACEVTVFSDLYEKCAGLLVEDKVVLIQARVNYRNDEAGLVAVEVVPIEQAEEKLTRAIHIRLGSERCDDALSGQLAELLGARPGPCDVFLHCVTPEKGEVTLHATSACRVDPSPQLRQELEQLVGAGTVWLSGGNGYPRHED